VKPEIDLSTCTEAELWHHVAAHLEASGVGVVLVGGAVVAIYTEGAYRSGDLDFVPEELFENRLQACMEEIGFHLEGRHFEHPSCPHLFVEFVAGPLGIGNDVSIVPREEDVQGRTLKILSPTDCVRDRLASYIHFRARECLDQALLVVRAQAVDWDAIERWCLGEGPRGVEAFEELKRLARR
jgi:hypothetical protein